MGKFTFKQSFCFLALLAGAALFMQSCRGDEPATTPESSKLAKEFTNDVVHTWNETFLQVERYAAGYRPGPAPRATARAGPTTFAAIAGRVSQL